jgi:hypothetical protein
MRKESKDSPDPKNPQTPLIAEQKNFLDRI